MDDKNTVKIAKLLREKSRRKKWRKIFCILAAIVVFCTTYALILPAVTLERETVCGVEEHIHTEACYTDKTTLICTQEETEAHVHTDSCYQEESRIMCEEPESEEHVHTEACYDTERILTCGKEETEGHKHGDNCYQMEHLLTCQKEEHTHGDNCYAKNTAPASDSDADIETQSGWESTLSDIVLTGDWSRDVLAVAQSQLGYAESSRNFVVDDDGSIRGYTRYGAWYGDPYGHWCAMFVSFCLNYAGVEGIPLEANCEQWITKLSSEEYNLYHSSDTYTPGPGDLVFFDMNQDGTSDHVGLVREFISDAETGTQVLETIEGNSGNKVRYVEYDLPDDRITGYGQLPEELPEEPAAQLAVMKAGSDMTDDLGGKEFVIASLHNSSRQYAMTSTPNGNNNRLTAVPVSVLKTDETNTYITGEGLTMWKFIQTGRSGEYYIQATDTGRYLSLTGSALTTSSTPQTITVTTSNSYPGRVKLSANNTTVDWFGNNPVNGDIFGPYPGDGDNNYQTLCTVPETAGGMLIYDLNVSSARVGDHGISSADKWLRYNGTTWEEGETTTSYMPSLASSMQTITEEGSNLYNVGERGTNGYFTVEAVTNRLSEASGEDSLAQLMKNSNRSPGKEFRFDGWKAAATDGVTYLFAEEAKAVLAEDGSIRITAKARQVIGTDADGNKVASWEDCTETVSLSEGTVMTGEWMEVSDIITFYVNYTGTILDTEGNVGSRNSNLFTRVIGIGHVYFGKQQAGTDTYFGNATNEAIRMKFTDAYDEKGQSVQIVMDYVTTCKKESDGTITYETTKASGINGYMLDEALMSYIRMSGEQIHITSADKTTTGGGLSGAVIDSANATTDNYSVRWYVMKEHTNGWHIDGVMVAKTAEIAVTKTFSGITTDEAGALLGDGGTGSDFRIPVRLGADRQEYFDITAKTIAGQVDYYGSDSTTNLPNSYHWTLHAITGEQYTLSEENYNLKGYDVSSIIVHHYYNSRTGENKIEYIYGDSTEEFGEEMMPEVCGGMTTAVSFNNFYTPTGTGAMAIVKRDNVSGPYDSYGLLKGAGFALYTDPECTIEARYTEDGRPITAVSNDNGTAYFNGLEKGTYYLKETSAPSGYHPSDKTWTVEVTEEADDDTAGNKIVVTLYENDDKGNKISSSGILLYDGGIRESYTVRNTADTNEITVTKTFSGLTSSQLNTLVSNSVLDADSGEPNDKSEYYIRLAADGADGEESAGAEDSTSAYLCLNNASRSQDGYTFTWHISDLKVQEEDGTPVEYTLTEHNFMLDAYADTAVTALMNGESQDVMLDRSGDLAVVEGLRFGGDKREVVAIANRYLNTFDLRLKKVDSSDPQGDGLEGAEFKIYGPYHDSGDVSDYFNYTDEEGNTERYYYIQTIVSDKDGIATATGLRLSKGENTFVYVLNEETAPDGYVTAKPQIITMNIDIDDENYNAGVLSCQAPNTREEDFIHRTLDTVKEWEPDTPSDTTKVTMELYRVSHFVRETPLANVADATLVAQVTLDGRADDPPAEDLSAEDDLTTIKAYESAPWVAAWMNLPSANADKYADTGEHYHYFVREVVTNKGYVVSYTCYDENGDTPDGAFQKLRVTDKDGNNPLEVEGVLIADMDEAYTVTVTNTAHFELPKSGGTGTLRITIGGMLLMAASLLCGYKLRRRRERRLRY